MQSELYCVFAPLLNQILKLHAQLQINDRWVAIKAHAKVLIQ